MPQAVITVIVYPSYCEAPSARSKKPRHTHLVFQEVPHSTHDTLSQATHIPLLLRHPLGQGGITLQPASESSQGSQPERRPIRAHTEALKTISFDPSLMGNQMDLHVCYSRWVASATGHCYQG